MLCSSAVYWNEKAILRNRWLTLTWFWWLQMISVLWNLDPELNGKDINGTYWMHYKANMFELKSEFKELKRQRKDLGDSCFDTALQFIWSMFFLHFPMFVLNAIAVVYFTFRILAFRLGFLQHPKVRQKRDWHKRKRKKKRLRTDQKQSTCNGHVFATAFNIDQRAEKASSTRFDSDSSTIICDNSANVHICNDKNAFIGEIHTDKSCQVATIGVAVTIARWALAPFVGRGRMTMVSRTRMKSKMCSSSRHHLSTFRVSLNLLTN